MKNKFGIIGTGVMGQAILHSVVNQKYLNKKEIAIFDISDEKRTIMKERGFNVYQSADELVKETEYILIAIKPQHFDSLANSIKITEQNTVISIMAGVKISIIKKKLTGLSSVVRVMPNTPCQIGHGVCAITFDGTSDVQESFVKGLFDCCGEIVNVEEKYFDAVTSISGSGPAYVYMFIDGMIKGGIDGGLDYEQSKKLAINTVIGAATLALRSEESPDVLTERVCSKGGTTIEAVKIYQERCLKDIIRAGIAACKKRSEEMSNS